MIRRIFNKSVFRRMEKGSAMETVLATMFHRLSATLYLIYCVWAVVSIVVGIPILIRANGEEWQTLFSIAVLCLAAPSCFGAAFWPSFARLELFAGAMFTALLCVYMFFVVSGALFSGDSWARVILVSSVLVVPAFRFTIVMLFLLKQAEEREEGE